MSGMFGKYPEALLLVGILAATTGCRVLPVAGGSANPIASPASSPAPAVIPVQPSVAPSANVVATAPSRANLYRDAAERAASATALSQIAQSQDDWRLTVSRWQQAIALLRQVPTSNPDYKAAQAKLPDYRRRLSAAQQQAARSAPANARIVSRRSVTTNANGTATTSAATSPSGPATPTTRPAPGSTFRVPIVRRAGGTPVIKVTFNGGQQFDMILDTGASGTLVTPAMAAALNLTPAGETRVNTANSRDVALSLAYVNSIEAGGAIAQNVLVAVSGPELSIGLLGQDFFGQYDVTIRQNEVELRAR